jgi:uncharacterized protein involved in exopolysaccharide biosynthesis
MAIQVETPAQLSEIGAVFRRRRWWLYVPILFALGIGALLTQILPKKYEVEAQLKLLEVQYDDEDFFRTKGTEGALDRNLATAEDQIKEHSRIHRLIDQLGWVDFLGLDALEKQDYVKMVQDNLTVEVLAKSKDSGSTFIDLTYRDVDQDRAELFLRTLVVMWVDETFDLDRSQIQKKLEAQRALVTTLDQQLEQLRIDRRDLISRNDLPFDTTKGQRDTQSGDHIYVRYQAADTELARLRIERRDVEDRLAAVEAELGTLQAFLRLSEVEEATRNDDGLLPILELQLEALEEELANLRQSHPQYPAKIAERDKLRGQIAERTGGKAASTTETVVPNEARVEVLARRNAIQRELESLDVRIEGLQEQRDADLRLHNVRLAAHQQLDKIERDIADKERLRGENLAKQSSFESDLESLVRLGSSYEITKEPLAPTTAVEPNVYIVMIGAVVFGALVGLLFVLSREYLVTGFRIPSDVGADIAVPILGIVGEVTNARQRIVRRIAAGATGVATVLFVALVVFFIYAWEQRPDLLGSELVESIEKLQFDLR